MAHGRIMLRSRPQGSAEVGRSLMRDEEQRLKAQLVGPHLVPVRDGMVARVAGNPDLG